MCKNQNKGRRFRRQSQTSADGFNTRLDTNTTPSDMASVWTTRVDPDANEDHTDSTEAKCTRFIKRDTGGLYHPEIKQMRK